MQAIISVAALWAFAAGPAAAVAPDECEHQRAMFPKDWNDVSKEQPLFVCHSHYSGSFEVTLGEADKRGRRLMSLVPLEKYPKKLTEVIPHLAVWGASAPIADREIFRHRRPRKRVLLDPWIAEFRRRQNRFDLFARQHRSRVGQSRRGLLLQQGAALQRVSRRRLYVRSGQVISWRWSCRAGQCGTCKIMLLDGAVEHDCADG
jgi:hypothetical protein